MGEWRGNRKRGHARAPPLPDAAESRLPPKSRGGKGEKISHSFVLDESSSVYRVSYIVQRKVSCTLVNRSVGISPSPSPSRRADTLAGHSLRLGAYTVTAGHRERECQPQNAGCNTPIVFHFSLVFLRSSVRRKTSLSHTHHSFWETQQAARRVSTYDTSTRLPAIYSTSSNTSFML